MTVPSVNVAKLPVSLRNGINQHARAAAVLGLDTESVNWSVIQAKPLLPSCLDAGFPAN